MARLRPLTLALVALTLVVAGLAVGVAKSPGGSPVPKDQEKTLCWSCHLTYAPPLKHFTNILPPKVAVAPSKESNPIQYRDGAPNLDYSVRVNNGYGRPTAPYLLDITHSTVQLDLRQAPSLKFGSAPTPIKGLQLDGSITFLPSAPGVPSIPSSPSQLPALPAGTYRGSTQMIAIQDGATHVQMCLTGSAGPILDFLVFAQNATKPSLVVNGTTSGETLCVDPAAALALGSGNFTLAAQYTFPDARNPTFTPAPGSATPFQAQLDVDFSADGAVQTIVSNQDIPAHGNKLFTFRIANQAPPKDGESIRITVNTTVFHFHTDPNAQDWENITTTLDVPVRDDGQKGSRIEATTTIVVPTIQNGATATKISEAVGYASAFLLISSNWSGGIFGQASRRQLNKLFTTARRRIAFHNFLSYGLTIAALVHMLIFLVRLSRDYQFTLGLIWGGIAILAMFALGVTGALQIPMIRKWGYKPWQQWHFYLGIGSIVFTLVHMGLDGANFGFIQDALHWHDPFAPVTGAGIR